MTIVQTDLSMAEALAWLFISPRGSPRRKNWSFSSLVKFPPSLRSMEVDTSNSLKLDMGWKNIVRSSVEGSTGERAIPKIPSVQRNVIPSKLYRDTIGSGKKWGWDIRQDSSVFQRYVIRPYLKISINYNTNAERNQLHLSHASTSSCWMTSVFSRPFI